MLRAESARWHCFFAQSVDEAIRVAETNVIDAVVSDVSMPGKTGLDLLAEFKSREQLKHIPVIILTGSGDSSLKREALNAGAVDLLTKPVESADLKARLENVLKIKGYEDQLRDHTRQLEQRVAERTRDLEASRIEIVLRLAAAGEYRDTDTGHHVVRVAQVSRVIAQHLKLDAAQCDQILLTSPLHDIGKVGIPDSILRKHGPLTPQERQHMQQHCEIGHAILRNRGLLTLALEQSILDRSSQNELLDIAARIALHHHERWDGTGYPHHLAGHNIPIEARIVGAADMFDALCSRRPYKDPVPLDRVRSIMATESGRHIDPSIWMAMDAAWPALSRITTRLVDAALPATGVAA